MDKIIDRLYLGNLKGASDFSGLKAANITHVLQVANGIKPFFPKDFKYKVISIPDTSNYQLIRHFPAAISFIREGMAKGGVLVHCYAGVSRSASCVMAYLMQERDMKFQEAFAFASKRRPVIFPNMGFQRQLREFEQLLLLKKSYASPKRVEKSTQKLITGLTVGQSTGRPAVSKPADELLLKGLTRSLRGPNHHNTQGVASFNQTITDPIFFDQDVPQSIDEFARATFFDRSDDRLGRLAEINKSQMEQAMRDIRGFARTDAGFNQNRKLIRKNGNGRSTDKKDNHFKPMFEVDTGRRFSPTKINEDKLSGLRLDKQAVSSELIDEQRRPRPYGSTSFNFGGNIFANNQPDPHQQLSHLQDYTSSLQKQGSRSTLKKHDSRPKTNQSSARRPLVQSQQSLEAVQKTKDLNRIEKKNYSITVGNNVHQKNSKLGDFIFQPDSPVGKKNKAAAIAADSLFNQSAFQQLAPGKQNLNAKFARQLYVCVGCNTPLFTSKDIVEHQSLTSASMGRNNPAKSLCTCIYVRQREWMIMPENRADRGILECYRKVCKRKLGQFAIKGLRCNCGKQIKPAFQIMKNKVKLVGSQSTSINLGASGSSLQHLVSSSDLSKYQTNTSGNAASISYGTNNWHIRDYGGPKSNEERFLYQQFQKSAGGGTQEQRKQKPLVAMVYKQKHEKLDQLLGSSYQNRKRGLPMGLTLQNIQNAAYSRAEKMLHPPYREALVTSSVRDPYSGLNKVFAMPNSGATTFEFGGTRPSYDGNLNRSAQIDDILGDRINQGHIVNNVMDFFRYKDPERYGYVMLSGDRQQQDVLQLPTSSADPVISYSDNVYNAKIQSVVHSRRQSSTQKLDTIMTQDSVMNPMGKKTHTQISLNKIHQGSALANGHLKKQIGERLPPKLQDLKVSGASQTLGKRILANQQPTVSSGQLTGKKSGKNAAGPSQKRQEVALAHVVSKSK